MAGKDVAVKKYVVRLSAEERAEIEALIRKGKSPAQRLLKGRILLKADVSDSGEGGATAGSSERWRPVPPWFTGCASNWWRWMRLGGCRAKRIHGLPTRFASHPVATLVLRVRQAHCERRDPPLGRRAATCQLRG